MHRNHLTTHINEWHRCILVITRAGFVFRSVKCMKIFTPSITDDILPLCCCRYCCRRHHRCHIGKHMLCTHRHHFNANSLDCSTFNYIIVNTLIKHRFHLCGAYSLFIFIQRNLLFYVITCKSTGWMVFLVLCARMYKLYRSTFVAIWFSVAGFWLFVFEIIWFFCLLSHIAKCSQPLRLAIRAISLELEVNWSSEKIS